MATAWRCSMAAAPGSAPKRLRAFAIERRHGGGALVLVAVDGLRQFQCQLGKGGHQVSSRLSARHIGVHEQMRSARTVRLMGVLAAATGGHGAPR